MKYAVGYQLPAPNDCMSEIVRDYREHIAEMYFAAPGASSGRSALGKNDGWSVEEVWQVMAEELSRVSEMNVDLVLLFNASCYGAEAMSQTLERRVRATIDQIREECNLSAITTTSPVIARIVKESYKDLRVRASVNMRIGTVKAMQYLASWFDGYYMQREWNRSPQRIERLRKWCDENGKTLHLLANSGCLQDCSFQSFHDNLVAHESDIDLSDAIPSRYPAPCWEFLDDPKNHPVLLQNTWIRPEDIHHYEKWFSVAKLATRLHDNPRQVIAAYVNQSYRGNLLDLFEPGHTPLLGGKIIYNPRFPEDWHEHVTSCEKRCDSCNYCKRVFDRVLIDPRDAIGE